MQEEAFELGELISGYLLCTLTEEQEQRLMFLLVEDKERYKLLQTYRDATAIEDRLTNLHKLDVDQAWLKVNSRLQVPTLPVKRNYGYLKYAAIFLAIVGSFVLYFNNGKPDLNIVPDLSKAYKNDVLPGTQKAILILSDGEEVVLDKENKMITDEYGVDIVSNNGQISYQEANENDPLSQQYNTLRVPRAGTYTVILPDGSKVMLNAMSALRYPVAFTEKDRRVELKGEAYFEVAKDAARPFKVIMNESEVEVLGTHFNVSSYDQSAKTTLLEGSVKVSNGKRANILIPGNQAIADKASISISKGDLQKAVAWSKGDFYFDNDDIEQALIEVSRWYDLKLIYKKPIPNIHISGRIKRQVRLSEVVGMLKDVSNLSFDIQNRNLIIN